MSKTADKKSNNHTRHPYSSADYSNLIFYAKININRMTMQPKKRSEKKLTLIEPSFAEVLVCENKSAKPYLEIFIQEPENISQAGLGTFFGIFEIADDSPDSSYIVNYLISVVKKEYFSLAKRGAIESFEAALHKANLALSKLAEHESISWIGHLNSVCGVIEKNNLHLAQTGKASAFLLRLDMLTPIIEPEENDLPPNPLKIFQDVLSGRLEEGDKLILTTETLFDIFSLSEIKKSALKFSRENFIQFLKTALSNELDRAAVLVVDIVEKELPQLENSRIKKPETPKNVFSQKAFEKKPEKIIPESNPVAKIPPPKEKIILAEIKEELKKNSTDDFVDSKTGHIYIKEDEFSAPPEKKSSFLTDYKNKITGQKESLTAGLGKIKPGLSHIFAKTKENLSQKTTSTKSLIPDRTNLPHIDWKKYFLIGKENFLFAAGKTALFSRNIFIFLRDFGRNTLFPFIKTLLARSQEKYRARKITIPAIPKRADVFTPRNLSRFKPNLNATKIAYLWPDFSKLKEIFGQLDPKRKIILAGVILAIVIIPYYLNQMAAKEEPEIKEVEVIPASSFPLEQDKNVTKIESLASVYSGNEIIKTINVNGEVFVITKDKIINPSTNDSFPIANNPVEIAWEMDDLNLILLLGKDQKVISFSPTSSKFQENNISIPADAKVACAKSYLTYAYLLDTNNNQIYRYPRAEGGFGEKSNWLKDTANLADTKDMAISEDVFIITGQEIQKFSRGKKEVFKLEETATPIIPAAIYTKPESTNLFVLDKNNSRVINLDTEGKIIAQYYHADIANATDITVNEEKKEIYIYNENEVKKFNLL